MARFSHHMSILRALVVREVEARYKSTAFGVVWYLISNIFMIALYSVVFSSIFKGRWSQPDFAAIDFTAVMFVGLLFYNCMNEVMARAPNTFLSQSSIVKRMVFPVFILPLVPVCVALFNTMVAAVILTFYCLYANVTMHWTGVEIFIVLVPFTLILVAISYFLAASAVYMRDLVHLTALLGTVLMFLSTLFYPIGQLHEPFNTIARLNPINYPIDEARRLLLLGQSLDLERFGWMMLTALVVLVVSLVWYRLLRPGFVDVL